MGLFPKSLSRYFALAGIPLSKGSKVFIVDAVNGSDSNTGLTFEDPLLTVAAALALTTTLHNDVVLLVGNGTSYAEAAIDWHHDFTHLIGLNSGGPEPRSRIKCTAALATTPFFTVSGDGCIIKNISFWHETTNAAGLVNVLVSGSRNTFEGCQFAGGVGANAATGARSLKIGAAGEGSGNTFRNCWIGCDTITAVDGMAGVEFVSGAMHTLFEDCIFAVSTNGTTYAHVTAAAAAGVGRLNVFRRCTFINEGNGVQASVFVIGAALPVSSYIVALDCWQYGATDWNHDNNGLLTNVTIAANTTGVNSGNLLIKTSA
jgi:hypothetical protein